MLEPAEEVLEFRHGCPTQDDGTIDLTRARPISVGEKIRVWRGLRRHNSLGGERYSHRQQNIIVPGREYPRTLSATYFNTIWSEAFWPFAGDRTLVAVCIKYVGHRSTGNYVFFFARKTESDHWVKLCSRDQRVRDAIALADNLSELA